MRILYIWDSDYPWDIRVEKICDSLTQDGHQLHIAARNLKCRPKYEYYKELHIHRLHAFKMEKLNYAYSFPLFFSPVWLRFIHKIICRHNIDLVIVRDLPLAITGIWAAKMSGVPIVFDMAEDYVALNKAIWDSGKNKGVNYILRHPFLSKLIERYVFKRCNHILVVVEETKEMVLKRGVCDRNVTVVSNTPIIDKKSVPPTRENQVIQRIRSKKSAIYVGGLQKGRGIHIVIEALPEIIREIPDFLFVVVGDGYAAAYLKELVHTKGMEKHVFFAGWIDHNRLADYIGASRIGVIPHIVNEHKNTTVPNKLFDYMQYALPVIASDAKPLERIINHEKCGLVFENKNAHSLAQAVISIINSDNTYGENGIKAVQSRYNWKHDSEQLKKVIASFR